jgi:hypothetical protein
MKKPPERSGGFHMHFLQSSRNFAGADAAGADVLSDDRAVFFHSYALDVGVPLSSGVSVGVGNVVAGNLTLAADLTFSGHVLNLLYTPKRVEIIASKRLSRRCL